MNIWDQLVDCICRPPRDAYDPRSLLGGPSGMLNSEAFRKDFQVVNKKGQRLECSHYIPLNIRTVDGRLPVVVYCHCNSGSKRDADEAVVHLVPAGISVLAFDFSGSGLSEGQWVTLGANEVDDLEVVIEHLRAENTVSSIGLWGRSMGAVTALMYSARDPTIAGMVLDSPFSRLTDLMLDIVVQQRLPIPKMMLKMVLGMMRKSVRKKAGFDINSVAPIDLVPNSVIPAVFGHGTEDSFINSYHSERLQAAYGGEYRNLVRFEGDHNHQRPQFFYDSVVIFFYQQLRLGEVLVGAKPLDSGLLRQASTALSEQEHAERANGGTNQPWQVASLPDLSESQAAAAALEAAAANNSSSSNAGVPVTSSGTSGSGTSGPEHGSSVNRRGARGWRLAPEAQVQGVLPSRNSPGSTWWSGAGDLETRGRSQASLAGVAEDEDTQLAAALALSLQQARLDEERRARLRAESLMGVQEGEAGEAGAVAGPGLAQGEEGGGRVSAGRTASSSSRLREQEQQRPTSAIPRSSQEEEEMLAMALALSLQGAEAASASLPDPVTEAAAGASTPSIPRIILDAGEGAPPLPATARSEVSVGTTSESGTEELAGKSRASTPRSHDQREQVAAAAPGAGVGTIKRTSSSGSSAMRQRVSPRQLQQHIQQQQQQAPPGLAPAAGIAVAHMPRRQHHQQQQQAAQGTITTGPLGSGAAAGLESSSKPQVGVTKVAAAAGSEARGQAESPGAAVDVDVLPSGGVGGPAGVAAVGKAVQALNLGQGQGYAPHKE